MGPTRKSAQPAAGHWLANATTGGPHSSKPLPLAVTARGGAPGV